MSQTDSVNKGMKKLNYKREFHVNLIGGVKNLEEHFTQMAEKGWLIEKMGAIFFRYKATEPRKLRFCVDVLPEIGIFDYPENEGAKHYHRLCGDAGWNFVAAQKNIHVFFTEESNPEPLNLHTDTRVQNQVFMRAYRKTELVSAIVNIASMCLLIMLFAYIDMPFLLYDLFIFTIPGLFAILLVAMAYVIISVGWYIAAWRACKYDCPLPVIPRGLCRLFNISYATGFLVFTCLFIFGIVLEVMSGFVPLARIALSLIIATVFLIVLYWLLIRIDTRERSRKRNILSFAAGIISVLVILAFISIIGINRIPLAAREWARVEWHPPHLHAVSLQDLGLVRAHGGNVIFREERTSLAVSAHYVLTERNHDGDINTRVYQTTSGFSARRMFGHAVSGFENGCNCPHCARDAMHPAPHLGTAPDWGADEGVFLTCYEGNIAIILRRDTDVLSFWTLGRHEIDTYRLQQAVREIWRGLE